MWKIEVGVWIILFPQPCLLLRDDLYYELLAWFFMTVFFILLQSKHHRHNAVKRRSTSSITSPPTSPTFSVSSDDQPPPTVNQSLTVAELENVRSVSQYSNYTSVSSATSFDDLVIAVASPEHVPTENGIYSSDLSEFPSVGPPTSRKLQESTLVVSTSDINLESKDSPTKSPVIMVDVFDDDVSSGTEDDCMSPTTQLHATNGAPCGSILATNASENISKLEDSPEAAAEIIVPDVDVLSQEILSHISTVGMTLDEDLFAKLPGEDSPIIQRKLTQHTAFPSATISSTPHQTGVFPSSSYIDDTSYDPSLASVDNGTSFSSIGNKDSSHSTPTTRHRYQDSHKLARKMASSNSSLVSKDSEHYHVHISPHVANKNKQSKQIKPSSNLLNGPRSSPPKLTQHDKYQTSSVNSPPVSRQWREISPQNSDEPNEEFVLPPPPQFQCDDITGTQYDATHVNDFFTNRSTQSPKNPGITRSASSASRLMNSQDHSSPTTSRKQAKSLEVRKHYSASGLVNIDNGEEEVLLTDMLKSLDQMAEEKYHAELNRQLSKEKNSTIPGAGVKSEKPSEKKKEKKKPKRRSTVGIFSFEDLIKQSIREDRAVSNADSPPNSKSDDNKVKKLAREYSKRVKDRPVFGKKRFSVHSYENFSGSGTNTPELRGKDPSWKTTADEHRMAHSRSSPLSPSADPKRKLPSITSGTEMDYSNSTGRGVSAKSSSSIANQSAQDYSTHPSPKINKFKSSPVVRSSSPIRSRIEGFEMLSQPKDDVTVPHKVIVGQTDSSKSKNPLQFPAKGKSFVSLNRMKSQEDLSSTSNGAHSRAVTGKQCSQPHNLSVHSRKLSKSHGSLSSSMTAASSTSSKQYRGLSVFSPDKVDDSDVIYRPPGHNGGKDEFENIRVKGGFKGWVKNLVDKFSK